MVHLNKHRQGAGSKLLAHHFSPFPILKNINDNAYVMQIPEDQNISPTFNVTDDLVEYFPPDEDIVLQENSETSSSAAGEILMQQLSFWKRIVCRWV